MTRALVAIGRKYPEYKTRHITYAARTPDWTPTGPEAGVEKVELIDFDLQRKQSIEQESANGFYI